MNAADAAVLLEQSLEGISFVSINVKSVGKTNKGQDAVTLFAVTNTGSLIEVLVRSGDAAAFDFAQDKVLSVVDAKQIEAFRKQVSRHTV